MQAANLKGKSAVITGAGRGLGAAFAVVLADLGADVIMTGRTSETLYSTAEAIPGAPLPCPYGSDLEA